MNAGYSRYAFGTWPNSAPLYPTNTQPLQLYVDPLNGHDYNNQAASAIRPLRTMREVTRRIVAYAGPVEVHLKSGTYVLPDGGVFLESRMLNGMVHIFGDEEWDPNLFAVLFEGVAQDGTDEKTIFVIPGDIVTDQLNGYILETTHNGVRERRLVRNNVSDSEGPDFIKPTRGFTNGLTDGDTFRVLSPNAVLQAAPIDPELFVDSYVFAADCPSYPPFNLELTGGTVNNPGLFLEYVQLTGENYFGMYFGRLPLWAYGVIVPGSLNLNLKGTMVQAGTGFSNSQPEVEGMGIGIVDPDLFGFYFEDALFAGHLVSAGSWGSTPSSRVELYGGRFFRMIFPTREGAPTYIACDGLGDPNTVKVLFDTGITGSPCIDTHYNTYFRMGDVELFTNGGAGVLVRDGSTVEMQGDGGVIGSAGGGTAVQVDYGQCRCIIEGAPSYGDPLNLDYVVVGEPPQNKSFFAAPGDAILSTADASVIVRTN
jgi:hypothetical protein